MSRKEQDRRATESADNLAAVVSDKPLPSGVITALFTDIVGSSQLKGLMSGETSARRDAAYRRDIKEPHDAVVLEAFAKHGGRIVNPTGDGFSVVFLDAEEAVLCAVEIQEELVIRPIPTPLGTPLQIRVGIHTGYAELSGSGIIATAMDKAARVQSKAEGGQVLVSSETHALVHDKVPLIGFESRGAFDLKGIGREELFIAFRSGRNPLANTEVMYREHITQRFGKLTLYSVTSDKPLAVDLEQIFVKVVASKREVVAPDGESAQQIREHSRTRKKRVISNDFLLAEDFERRFEETTITVNEALREQAECVVLGAPGSGKTTLLKYIALSFARQKAKQRLELDEDRLPLYVALRDLNRWLDAREKQSGLPPQLPAALLPQFLSESYAANFPRLNLPSDFFSLVMFQKKCAVLLDGLDEIADSLKRIRAAEFVAACLRHYAGNRFILTSRPRGYETACRQHLTSACRDYSIQAFDDDQIRSFAESWYLAVTIDREGDNPTARDHAKQSAEDLLRAMQTDRVRPLATNPLLLSILALIHQRGNRLPQRRVTLYEECIEFLLGYWRQVQGGEAARELAEVGGLSRMEKRALLEPVALWMHERGEEGTEVSQRELEEQLAGQFVELYGLKQGEALRRACDFVSIIVQHAGLLVERENGVFAFAHLTFQEFLAARALADLKDFWPALCDHLHDPWWREVILLLAGFLSNPGTRRAREDTARLLNKIRSYDLVLAFRCLCDMEQLGVEDTLWRELVAEVFDLWQKSENESPTVRDEILDLFRYATPTRALALIIDRLLTLCRDGNDDTRSSAVSVLTILGAAAATPQVLTQLLAMIENGSEFVSSRAAFALGELGATAATPDVLERLLVMIQDGNEKVSLIAAYALAKLPAAAANREVLTRLRAMIQGGNEPVSTHAAHVLAAFGAASDTLG
jgi:class 3 adenylate cyclase/energy-coupling factor transporter ATP-binding protein EcfA2